MLCKVGLFHGGLFSGKPRKCQLTSLLQECDDNQDCLLSQGASEEDLDAEPKLKKEAKTIQWMLGLNGSSEWQFLEANGKGKSCGFLLYDFTWLIVSESLEGDYNAQG